MGFLDKLLGRTPAAGGHDHSHSEGTTHTHDDGSSHDHDHDERTHLTEEHGQPESDPEAEPGREH